VNWIDLKQALAIHQEQIAAYGGGSGIRDLGLLESALARPQNIAGYDPDAASISRLAAAYAFGIVSNHPFVDGNKRTGLVVAFTFVEINGGVLTAGDLDAYQTFLALAAGEIDEPQLTDWFRINCSEKQS
jgi:death-on-curing protein